jgi:two-component system chemotaxis response regulator CheY
LARKILLADDSVTAQNMGRKILADAGYEVVTVNNGSAALKKIAELKPDLIILDVYMPGYSGLEVCQRLKEAQETARIPVLLTVGKLEPFKPEEAKRVRAEGYIVKPFEASELLSALSKLEDKIVPRPEPSKPGRFARAAAAEESGRTSEAGEEDAGWKSRIGFPSKKTKKQDEESVEDTANLGAMNKDSRPAAPPEAPKERATKFAAVDPPRRDGSESAIHEVLANFPPGLPRDVTPEEIAAIAAAAAHVQGVVASARASSEGTAESRNFASPVEAQPPAQAEANSGIQAETKTEEKIESRPDEAKSIGHPTEAGLDAEPAPATFAGIKSGQHADEHADAAKAVSAEVQAATQAEIQKDTQPSEPPSHAEVIAAIATLEPANGKSWDAGDSGNGRGALLDEPASLVAAPSVAPAISAGPRWTAVPSALDAGETAISLELEMQKAYAAFAAAEANQPGFVTSALETSSPAPDAPAIENSSSVLQAAVAELLPAAPAPEPELAKAEIAMANAPAEGVGTSWIERASATVSALIAPPLPVPLPIEPELAPFAPVAETTVQAEPVVQSAEAAHEEKIEEKIDAPVSAPEASVSAASFEEAPKISAPGSDEPHITAQPVSSLAETVVAETVAAETVTAEASSAGPVDVKHDSAPRGVDVTAKGESDLHASTVAAWASWRQIRESGDPRSPEPAKASKREQEDDEEAAPVAAAPDTAAMAVAAGAEKTPAEGPAVPEADSIASMVDSVMADLRPKILAEISKKLSEKK